jgi:S-adenosylmethionine-diacylglycerol 3-amino-3-carboxypropyl transferase
MGFLDYLSRKIFTQVHGNNLVYNTCWEDPSLDREALAIQPDHRILMITSAGCNALDYLLDNPAHIQCVDLNPRQNALLQLKLAAIRSVDYETFFQMFGKGYLDNPGAIYHQKIRPALKEKYRPYWDRKIKMFSRGPITGSFYFRGTTGLFARLANLYINFRRARTAILSMYELESVEEREQHYNQYISHLIWTDLLRRLLGYDATLSLLGVPKPQREQLESNYQGGIVQFMEDSLKAVFVKESPRHNYFWRLYLFGAYTKDCCPEYLKPENFQTLRDRAEKISTFDGSLVDFLQQSDTKIDRFVLLDHMDWLATYGKPILEAEWQAIADRSAKDARILWRSAATEVDFIDPIHVQLEGKAKPLGEVLHYNTALASRLHEQDRVHTYGSFYIADWKT